jgi:hypothetical protein
MTSAEESPLSMEGADADVPRKAISNMTDLSLRDDAHVA